LLGGFCARQGTMETIRKAGAMLSHLCQNLVPFGADDAHRGRPTLIILYAFNNPNGLGNRDF
jgi:hypothetical protein